MDNNYWLSVSNKWADLYSRTKIIGVPWTASPEELHEFECETQIVLPHEFKEFCQVFGSGFFYKSGSISIDCPHSGDLDIYHGEKLERREIMALNLNIEDDNHNFICSSYDFGLREGESLCWDLTTYDPADQSYDIYLYKYYGNKKYLLGRSFFDFISKICIERQLFSELFPVDRKEMNNQPEFYCLGKNR